MKRSNVATSRKIDSAHVHDLAAPLETNLWDREALPVARDALFVGALLFYVIGFAYQSAKMRRFDMSVDLGDQQLSSLFSWAFEAIGNGAGAFAALALGVLALLSFAAYMKHRHSERPYCRNLVRAVITAVALLAVGGSAFVAWTAGWNQAELYLGSADGSLAPVRILPDPAKHTPLTNARTGTPAFILSETPDLYQVLLSDPAPRVLAIHRADVTLMYGPTSEPVEARRHVGGHYLTKHRASTPPPTMMSTADDTVSSGR